MIDDIFTPFLKGENFKIFDVFERYIFISDMLQIWQLQDGI